MPDPAKATVTVHAECAACGAAFRYERSARCPAVAPKRAYCSPRCHPSRAAARAGPAGVTATQRRASAAGRAPRRPRSAAKATATGRTPDRSRGGRACPGDDRVYDDEEREFLAAIEAFKKQYRRPFPSWSDALRVLKGLGYRKGAEGGR